MDSTPSLDPLGITGRVIEEKYLVMEVVGEGGAAVVYRAQHTAWGIPVAIKFFRALSDAPEAQREQLLAEFVQEGRIMTTLSSRSPVIVQPRDMGAYITDDGTWLPYMVMEWLDGEPLDAVLVRESQARVPPRTIDETVALLDKVGFALDLAHRDGIVHRDLKPENMVVLGNPRTHEAFVKVLDFGIAKVMQTSLQYVHTSTAATPFTPHYGAPEQFSRAHGSTGPWTDVFAMALVIIEVMRGGRRVFTGEDYVKLSEQSRSDKSRPTPRNLGLTVTDDVEAVFSRALAVDPTHRYATMGEFWFALHAALSSSSTSWVGAGGFRQSVPSIPAIPTPSSSMTPKTIDPASRRTSQGAIVVGALLLVGVAAVTVHLARRVPVGVGASAPSETAMAPSTNTVGAESALPVASVQATPALCPEDSVLIPGGRFTMGDDDSETASPTHRVSVDAFCLDRTEVSVAKYAACAAEGTCDGSKVATDTPDRSECNDASRGNHPENCVTWQSASAYCAWARKRLPTEAEWEYAAAGNERRKYPWGKSDLPKKEWKGTEPVGQDVERQTPLGVQGLANGVGEWVSDWHAPYEQEELLNPRGPTEGDKRVVRGATSLVAERRGEKPARAHPRIGFRCASPLAKP